MNINNKLLKLLYMIIKENDNIFFNKRYLMKGGRYDDQYEQLRTQIDNIILPIRNKLIQQKSKVNCNKELILLILSNGSSPQNSEGDTSSR